jgi:hypothetical protein
VCALVGRRGLAGGAWRLVATDYIMLDCTRIRRSGGAGVSLLFAFILAICDNVGFDTGRGQYRSIPVLCTEMPDPSSHLE